MFVSTCNAYPDWPDKPVDEDSPTWTDGEGYGPDKAAAERHVLAAGGAVVRAGLIVGPHDNIFRLPWWVRRIAEGGEVPAPGDPARPLQIIDARDLAAWLVQLAETRTAGAFNGTAPRGQTTMGELLEAAVAATGSGATLRWIPEERLEEAERRAVDGAPAVAAGAPSRHLGHRDRARAGGRIAHAAGRGDGAGHLDLAAKRRRGRARRLARRAPPAEDERRARGSDIPTPVIGIRAS